MHLPIEYQKRMQSLLGEDYPAYLAAMDAPASRALHVNLTKLTVEQLQSLLGEELAPIPYAEDGFYMDAASKLGKHPLHHAGAYYIQDPSAMAPVACASAREGMYVLDLCASPGGKSTQLANRIGKSGLLVSNEIVTSRAVTLAGNGERMGLSNMVVTNTDAPTLATLYPTFFDLVLVDAPCSGEGMFRKYPEAVGEWTSAGVRACAHRQRELLEDAYRTLKAGGELVYSTCTFSEEENEGVLTDFLSQHPEATLLPVPEAIRQVTADGIPPVGTDPALARAIRDCARRFYPHLARGEGQFMARLQKGGVPSDRAEKPPKKQTDALPPLPREEKAVWDAFVRETFVQDAHLPAPVSFKGSICLPTHGAPIYPKYTYACGVRAGKVEKGRCIPDHWLAMAHGHSFKRQLHLTETDPRLAAYLRGETFPCDLPDGWGAVLHGGCALGLIKVTGGIAKNHYPKGLRVRG